MSVESGGTGPLAILAGLFGLFGDNDDQPTQVTCEQMQAKLESLGFDVTFECDIDPEGGINEASEIAIETLGVIVEDLGTSVTGIENLLDTGISSFVESGDSVIDNIGDAIGGLLGDLFGNVDNDISALAAQILQAIGNTSQGAILNIQGVTNQVLGNIDLNAGTAIEVITGLFGATNSNINSLLFNSDGFLRSLTESAIRAIENTLGFSVTSFEQIFDNVGDAMILNLQSATDANQVVSGKIIEALDEQLEQSRLNAEHARGDLSAAIEAITGESESALAVTREALEVTGEAQVEATREGSEEITKEIAESNEQLRRAANALTAFESRFPDAEVEGQMHTAIREVLARTGCPENAMQLASDIASILIGPFTLQNVFAQKDLFFSIQRPVIDAIFSVIGNCAAQAVARIVPTALPDPSALRDQVNRRLITQDEAIQALLSQGFNLERAIALMAERRMLPDIGIIQTWFLRGFIDTDQAIGMLADLGLDNEAIENVIQMSFFIPPAGDLISMAVRDVFSPEITARFKQFEDFPQEFQQFAAQQGISEEWARRYWAAHWALPSPQQGFEMFQREVIDEQDLDTLLKALDVMPFWRDAMKRIAYRPLPRVDVRRMNQLGLIPNNDLPRRYKHFGFSPEDADMMAAFTIEYNKGGTTDDATELAGVTRSMALNLFKQGALTREQTEEVLLDQGMSQQAATILIENEIVEREITERKEQTLLIIEQAKAGTLTFDQAQDRLGQLGLEPTELTRALTTLERARAVATKIPSRADADRFLKAGVINDSQYLDLLERNGYSQVWSQRYLAAAQAG